MEVLVFLAGRQGEVVAKEKLLEAVWKDTFIADGALFRHISELRRLLGDDPKEPKYIETIPKRGYRLVARVESPMAELEATSVAEQNRQVGPAVAAGSEGGAIKAKRPARRLGWRLLALAVGLPLVMVAGWWGVNQYDRTRRPNYVEIDSVAVLPFEEDPATNQASLTAMAQVVEELTGIEGVSVVSSYSVIKVVGVSPPDDSVPEIAQQFGVSSVVKGRISSSGDRTTVAAELFAASGRSLWSTELTGESTEVGTLIASLAKELSRKVALYVPSARVRPEANGGTLGPSPVDALLLRMEQTWEQGDCTGYEKTREIAEKLIQLDPADRGNYALLIDIALASSVDGCTPPEPTLLRMLPLVEGAPLVPAAKWERFSGRLVFFYGWDWSTAKDDFKRAGELDPSDDFSTALFLTTVGQQEEAIRKAWASQAEEPKSKVGNLALALILYFARDFDHAVQVLDIIKDNLHPNHPGRHLLALSSLRAGKMERALATARPSSGASTTAGRYGFAPGYIYAAAGEREKALDCLRHWEERAKRGWVPGTSMALLHASVGNRDAAFSWLERAYTERDPWLVFLEVDPSFDLMRSDSRFTNLWKRVRFGATGGAEKLREE